ncbi:MAG: CoA transferase [Sphingomonas taxi]
MTGTAPTDPRDPPFTGLRVIELAEDPGGEMTGYLLAASGAEVLKLEPAGGAPARATGPFRGGSDDAEDSLAFWYYNSGKKSLRLDPGVAAQRPAFDALLARADILLTTLQTRRARRTRARSRRDRHRPPVADRPVADRLWPHRPARGLEDL